MIKLIDRLLVRGYLKSYAICLTSLLTLYIVVDLFTNLEDFAEHHKGLLPILTHIGTYYGFKSAQIFDRLCEAIVLMAAAFTVAWVQRNNELLPLLSAGVSTRRVLMPVLFSACAMLGLAVANQELLIPRIATYLMNDRDDPNGEKETVVQGAFEPNGIHIEGDLGTRRGMIVKKFRCVIPESIAGGLTTLTAEEARYIPPGSGAQRSGGWLMTGTQPERLEGWSSPVLEMIDPGKWFLQVQEIDFDAITRGRNWFVYASTARLKMELSKPDSTRLAPMAVLFHMRLTRPVLGMILLVLSLSVILRDQNRNIFISAGLCVILCGVFFAAQFVCKALGDNDYLSPAMAAWLPVLCFGPLALAMFDAIHT